MVKIFRFVVKRDTSIVAPSSSEIDKYYFCFQIYETGRTTTINISSISCPGQS